MGYMDAMVLQETLRLLTHEPSGRPKAATQALRRGIALGIVVTRAYVAHYGISPALFRTMVCAWATLSASFARVMLLTTGISPLSVGALPFLLVELVYTAGFTLIALAFLHPNRK